MDPVFTRRGFLPADDPAEKLDDPRLAILDELGHDLPSLLIKPDFRDFVEWLDVPFWPDDRRDAESLPQMRLYYVRLGFLASAYVNQVGQPPSSRLPANLARPLCHACGLLNRPPILSYDGYALYNWKRFDPAGPIALGNIDTLQNFIHLYDEHWFILVHVEIEAIAGEILAGVAEIQAELSSNRTDGSAKPRALNAALERIAAAVRRQVEVLRRIPERMDPSLYYRTFRPYIRFFENVVYEGVQQSPANFRGETGAQSSIMPSLVALMKIPHQPSLLTNHLADMRNFMPAEHRALIAEIEAIPDVRDLAGAGPFNAVLDAMAEFREVHFGWAQEYINKYTDDPRGTGGTTYMHWLQQLIDETKSLRK
jgi:indoleamine 2,3-dioxygenase